MAEALQQIPGVAVDVPSSYGGTSGGEGNSITVRGLGPQFNTVLLNGRRLATDSGSRSFNFDAVPADLLGGTDVFKSANVQKQEGAIGATIDMKTLRPLAMKDGLTAVGSARAFYDAEAKKTTPDLFGLVGYKTDDDRFGVLVSASFQKRKTISQWATNAFWQKYSFDADGSGAIDATEQAAYDSAFSGGKGNGAAATYWRPQKFTNDYVKNDQQRLGLNGTIQARPTDTITLSLDAMYGRFKVAGQGVEKAWFASTNLLPGNVADANGSLVKYVSEASPEFLTQNFDRNNTYWGYGGNLLWEPTSNFSTSLDVWQSVSKNQNDGTNEYYVIHGPKEVMTIDNSQGYKIPLGIDGAIRSYDPVVFPAGSPQLAAAQPVGSVWNRSNPNGYRSWWTTSQGGGVRNEITEVRWDNTLKFDGSLLSKIRFGAYYGKASFENTVVNADDVGWSNYGAYGIPLPASLFSQVNYPVLTTAKTPGMGQFLFVDGKKLIDYLLSPQALALRDSLHGLTPGTSASQILPRGYAAAAQPQYSQTVSEENWSLYGEATLKADLGDKPLVAVMGLRYAHTNQTASGYQQALLDFLDGRAHGIYEPKFGDLTQVQTGSKYGYLLPSLNVRFDVAPNLILRGSTARTLTRPDLDKLQPQIAWPVTPYIGSAMGAIGGNAGLKPYLAWNHDLSAEWYFRKGSYLSATYFKKNIDGFIVSTVVPYKVTIPNTGGYNDANVSGTTATFALTTNVNQRSASVSGLELALQVGFDFLPSFLSHTGFTASATFPSTGNNFDPTKDSSQTVFPGLSNSYFLTGFYDDGKLQARLSWSRRERYFAGFATATEPMWTLGRSQLDARVSYNLTNGVQVFADAYNFTNTPGKQVGRYDNHFETFWENGARYDVGVRFTL